MIGFFEAATTTIIIVGIVLILSGCTGRRFDPNDSKQWCAVSKKFCE